VRIPADRDRRIQGKLITDSGHPDR